MNSKGAYTVLLPLFDKDTIDLKEEFFLLLLNRANHVLGWFKVSSRRTSGTPVDIKIILILALKANAHSIILCHCHPFETLSRAMLILD